MGNQAIEEKKDTNSLAFVVFCTLHLLQFTGKSVSHPWCSMNTAEFRVEWEEGSSSLTLLLSLQSPAPHKYKYTQPVLACLNDSLSNRKYLDLIPSPVLIMQKLGPNTNIFWACEVLENTGCPKNIILTSISLYAQGYSWDTLYLQCSAVKIEISVLPQFVNIWTIPVL